MKARNRIFAATVGVCLLGSLVFLLQAGERNEIPEPARTMLEQATEFELYSLNPNLRNTEEAKEQGKETFHEWQVLGKTTVKDAKTRAQLLKAFFKGVKENDGTVAGCFNPRHGIRVVQGDQTVDFVICFECMSVSVYRNDKLGKGFLITNSPQPTFDAVLKSANVELAGQPQQD